MIPYCTLGTYQVSRHQLDDDTLYLNSILSELFAVKEKIRYLYNFVVTFGHIEQGETYGILHINSLYCVVT